MLLGPLKTVTKPPCTALLSKAVFEHLRPRHLRILLAGRYWDRIL